MPDKKFVSKNAIKIQKALLRKLARDERLHPSKRLLATMLLGVIDGIYPLEVLEAGYTKSTKVNWSSKDGTATEPPPMDNTNKEATTVLKSIFAEVED